MSNVSSYIRDHALDAMRIAGQKVGAGRDRAIAVFNPYTSEQIGSVPKATLDEVRETYAKAHAYQPRLTRFERAAILNKAAAAVRSRTAEIAALITAESGLCLKDSTYEAGRVADVLMFGALEVLKDDGQTFSCDITPHGRQRKVYTQRDPLLGVITAITPFNHPMNQVAHKVVPSVATNNRMVLKPSEKVPLSALLFADILYEAGLPPEMLSVVTGDPREIADELLTNPHVDLITFTGGVAIGKYIASKAGYRRIVLELGGNDGLRGLPPDDMRANLEQMVAMSAQSKARVLLVGMALPPNYGMAYTTAFSRVYADTVRQHRISFVPLLMAGFEADRRYFQADGLHPTAAAQGMMRDTVSKPLLPLLKTR